MCVCARSWSAAETTSVRSSSRACRGVCVGVWVCVSGLSPHLSLRTQHTLLHAAHVQVLLALSPGSGPCLISAPRAPCSAPAPPLAAAPDHTSPPRRPPLPRPPPPAPATANIRSVQGWHAHNASECCCCFYMMQALHAFLLPPCAAACWAAVKQQADIPRASAPALRPCPPAAPPAGRSPAQAATPAPVCKACIWLLGVLVQCASAVC